MNPERSVRIASGLALEAKAIIFQVTVLLGVLFSLWGLAIGQDISTRGKTNLNRERVGSDLLPNAYLLPVGADTTATSNSGSEVDSTAWQEGEEYALAAGHYERGEYAEAIERFRQVILQTPNTTQAALSYFFLGESHVQLEDFHSAYPAYEIFLQRMPGHDYARRAEFRMAECGYQLRWDEQATQLLERFIQKRSDAEDELLEVAITYLGEIRLRRQEPRLALAVFDRGLSLFPNTPNSSRNRLGMGRTLQALSRHDEAIRFYDLLMEEGNPCFPYARLQTAQIFFERGDLDRARSELNAAIQRLEGDPAVCDAFYLRGKVEMAGGNHHTAYEDFAAAIRSSRGGPTVAGMLLDGAIAAAKCEHPDIALEWLGQLQATWPDTAWADSALQLKIELLFQTKRFEDAERGIEQFLSEFSGHKNTATILEYRGRIEYERGQFQQAIDSFAALLNSSATEISNSQRGLWHYMQALSQMSLGRFGSAMENLEAIEPGGLEASLAESILLAKASTAVGLQRPELAITLFTEFLRLYEDSKSAERVRADLMIAYAQSKQWRDAERQFEKLQLDAPQDGLSNMTLESCLLLAELALQEKRFALAESCFASLVKGSHPRDFLVRGLSGLAWARMNQGDEDASIAIFERLVVEHAESGLAAEAAMACGRYFEQRDQFDRAADMYRVVQAKYPDSKFESLARLREAYCLYKIGGQPNLRNAERLLTTAPQPVGSISAEFADEVAYQLAWIYMQTEREEMAMERFNEIAESMPDSRYWRDAAFRVAQNALSTGDLEKARRLIDKLDMLEMDSALRTRFEFLRGQVAVEDRDWVQVQQSMTDVLAATDEEALRKRARYWLAESLYQLRDFPAAIQELRRLVSNSELIAPNRLAWVNLRLAQSLAENEEWSAALQQAQSCKAKFPEFEAAHEFDFVIGRVHATQGRLTQARKAFQEVVNSPIGGTTMTAAMAQWRIGETYFHQQEYERAIEAFYRVDALFSYKHWRAAALVEAGKCHEHLGNWNHATRLYRRLIDLFPDSEFRLTAEQRLHSAQRQANRLDGQTK